MTFTAHLLDIKTNDAFIAILHKDDIAKYSLQEGNQFYLTWYGEKTGVCLFVDSTETLVSPGQIGIFQDIWEKYSIQPTSEIKAELVNGSLVEHLIASKLLGSKLDKFQIESVVNDIALGKVTPVMTAYWVAAGFNPGFDFEEIVNMTRAMAYSGEVLKFDKFALDKHSVGGVGGKGITPIIISILGAYADIAGDFVVPNTSSKAITTASATADMLEGIMNMSFNIDQLYEFIKKENAFMIWGGGLNLAPADDRIIKVQKPLKTESWDKITSSIFAKKLAQGITHVLFDLPFGKYAKLKDMEDVNEIVDLFTKLGEVFSTIVGFNIREVRGIDGNAIGPNLECKEFLRILEAHDDASIEMLQDSMQMSTKLLNLKDDSLNSMQIVADMLTSGKAKQKLKNIVCMQNGDCDISSRDLKVGHIQLDIFASKEGEIKYINNKLAIEMCKALGNPFVKEAGIYFYKKPGDDIVIGDKLATLYATSDSRMNLARKVLDSKDLFEIE